VSKPPVVPVDNSAFLRTTEYPRRDAIYNWLVRRYGKLGHPWQKSDKIVFGGFLDYVWPWIPDLFFVYVMYFILKWTYTLYGTERLFMLAVVMVLFRLNALIRAQKHTNALLKS
jgi:hypothetical protein